MHYMYADLETGIYSDTKMVLGRLKWMRKRQKPRINAGDFLMRARTFSRRSAAVKAIMHWFRFVSLVESVSAVNLRRHDLINSGRHILHKGHLYSTAMATDRMDEMEPTLLEHLGADEILATAAAGGFTPRSHGIPSYRATA